MVGRLAGDFAGMQQMRPDETPGEVAEPGERLGADLGADGGPDDVPKFDAGLSADGWWHGFETRREFGGKAIDFLHNNSLSIATEELGGDN